MFARAFTRRFPLLPVEEEGRLHDWQLRENFIDCVFAYRRWTYVLEQNPSPGGLVQFHTAHKMTLMAHSPRHYQEMGRLVAQAGSFPWDEVTEQYGALLMEGMRELAEAEGCIGRKYCGGGWGGYALYLFTDSAERDAFVASANCNRAIEPYITIR